MSGLDLALFGAFGTLMVLGVPIGVALGLAGALVIALANLGMMSIPVNVWAGVAKYPLLAIPVFIFAGLVFEKSGVAQRIVTFATALVGHRRGGLGIVAILVCMVLGGISGSGPADAAAVATVLIPSMLRAGYPKEFSASLIAAAGSTAILIPPSIVFILYSVLVPQVSVPALFAAGLLPGLLAGICLMVPTLYLSHRHGFGIRETGSRPPVWKSFKEAAWGLFAPVIILGGMRLGLFTPSEAAVAAVAYGIFVGFVIHGTLTWRRLYGALVEAGEISAVVLTIIALASVFAYAGSTLGAFDHLASFFVTSGTGETAVLIAVTLILLFAGMFLDAVSILFIFIPILIPVAVAFDWDLVWFGVVLTMNMAIGQFTPPLAVNLMVTTRIAGISMESTVPWVLWMVGSMLAGLLLVTFVPEIALVFPRLAGFQ